MVLDVESPAPPDLTNREIPSELDSAPSVGSESGLHREELEDIFREGAWTEAFREWTAYTDLTEEEYRAIRDQGLFERLDFYWDPSDERLRFEIPDLPDEWDERGDLASLTRTELSDLGYTVIDMFEDVYLGWGEDAVSDPVWGTEARGGRTPPRILTMGRIPSTSWTEARRIRVSGVISSPIEINSSRTPSSATGISYWNATGSDGRSERRHRLASDRCVRFRSRRCTTRDQPHNDYVAQWRKR